jgi:hypothetical protein
MAIILRGRTTCGICRAAIGEHDDFVGFPAFVYNNCDPLLPFSDGAFHPTCLGSHPLRSRALERLEEWSSHTGPGQRQCRVCGQEVLNHADHLQLPHFTENARDPLYAYNYWHFHRSCLPRWQDRDSVIRLVDELNRSGLWSGTYLDALLRELRGQGVKTQIAYG